MVEKQKVENAISFVEAFLPAFLYYVHCSTIYHVKVKPCIELRFQRNYRRMEKMGFFSLVLYILKQTATI